MGNNGINGYQDEGRYAVSVCHDRAGSVALHRTEQPLLKDTMVVPQTYMAASLAGWERSEAVNGARRPSFCLGFKLLVKREGRCRCSIITRDRGTALRTIPLIYGTSRWRCSSAHSLGGAWLILANGP